MLTLAEVVAKFPEEVRNRYDFSTAVYTGALNYITGIQCSKHGAFKQFAGQLRKNGAGCPACGGEQRAARRRLEPDEVIARARETHGDRYSYGRMQYQSGHHKITVTCPDHGDFQILPINHIRAGQGCPTCGAAKRGHRKDVGAAARKTADAKLEAHGASFAAEAAAVHAGRYDYSRVVYRGRKEPVEILCPDHGAFFQAPGHHLQRQHGCPECSHHRSKGEAAILAFVSVFAETRTRDRSVINPKELDIYVPGAALAVEYCGEYWHAASSVDEERMDRTRHLDKWRLCEAKGIRLLTVYESEWLSRPHAIKHLIRNALGKGRGRVMARKCSVERVGHVEAAAFYERYHPQGGAGYGEHYGLRYGDKLVACMRFAFGANDRGTNADRQWTLSRYATRVAVPGGASRLFAAFVTDTDPTEVKSFSDNRYFAGGMYEKLGFALDEETPPDYQVYHPKTGLLPKTSWQRRKIAARIRDIGSKESYDHKLDPRSERTMTYLLGAQRMFDCGKKRWVWRKPDNRAITA